MFFDRQQLTVSRRTAVNPPKPEHSGNTVSSDSDQTASFKFGVTFEEFKGDHLTQMVLTNNIFNSSVRTSISFDERSRPTQIIWQPSVEGVFSRDNSVVLDYNWITKIAALESQRRGGWITIREWVIESKRDLNLNAVWPLPSWKEDKGTDK